MIAEQAFRIGMHNGLLLNGHGAVSATTGGALHHRYYMIVKLEFRGGMKFGLERRKSGVAVTKGWGASQPPASTLLVAGQPTPSTTHLSPLLATTTMSLIVQLR